MATKFKLGDRVRVISDEGLSANNLGDEGVITEESIKNKLYRVHVEGKANYSNWQNKSELELIKK